MEKRGLWLMCGLACFVVKANNANPVEISNLYRQISDGLLAIKRDFPAAQSKIYPLLDQIEKMHSVAKEACNNKEQLKKQLDEKAAESASLKTALNQVRQEAVQARKMLGDNKTELEQKLALQKNKADQLEQEHKMLLSKMKEQELVKPKKIKRQLASKDEGQPGQPNLSLISSSEPISPR